MHSRLFIVTVPGLALAIAACAGGGSGSDPLAETIQDSSQALHTTLSLSVAADGQAAPLPSFNPGIPGLLAGPCAPDRTVVATGTVCGISYPTEVKLSWDCTVDGDAHIHGSATVDNLITAPSGCSAGYDVNRTITLDRTRKDGDRIGELVGTAAIEWKPTTSDPGRSRHLTYQFDRKVTEDGSLVLHRILTGDKTVDFDLEPTGTVGDQTNKVVNGNEEVQHLLAGFDFNAAEAGLTYVQSCCYPVAGTFSWSLTGSRSGDGSLTFGPACGVVTGSNGSGSVTLPPCSAGW